MTKTQLMAWFRLAAPGDRILYYRGDLGRARKNPRYNRDDTSVADTARSLGTPRESEVFIAHGSASAEYGQGLAHLTKRRVKEGDYEYFITKAAVPA